jgi:hypothetical protein
MGDHEENLRRIREVIAESKRFQRLFYGKSDCNRNPRKRRAAAVKVRKPSGSKELHHN